MSEIDSAISDLRRFRKDRSSGWKNTWYFLHLTFGILWVCRVIVFDPQTLIAFQKPIAVVFTFTCLGLNTLYWVGWHFFWVRLFPYSRRDLKEFHALLQEHSNAEESLNEICRRYPTDTGAELALLAPHLRLDFMLCVPVQVVS